MAYMLKNTRSIDFVGREKLRKRCPLHDDLIAEILSYLPAKTFVRLLSVCKTFHQLSFDYHFHLLQSHHNTTISGFLVEYHGTNLSLLKVDPCTGVPKSSLEFLRNSNATILGSAGGLIFVLHGNEGSSDATTSSIFVYNPARRTRCRLPTPSGVRLMGSIAVKFTDDSDVVTEDYKLVYLSPTWEWSLLYHCRVYDSATRAWTMDKKLNLGARELNYKHPVVCGDVVFWASDWRSRTKVDPYVVAFDVREECTQIIHLPKEAAICCDDTIGIAKWEGNSLCLIHYRMLSCGFTLWLLRKARDGATGWVKANEISLAEMGLKNRCFVSSVMLCEVAKTVLLVFTITNKAYSYDLKDGELRNLGLCYPRLIPYSNTLRPCGQQEELL
ncbi:uncharacterized protein LOC135635968 [Musa acuminata AAA Group]|uniref:uncharacterized protein LOC135606644 n=1 Tax=Musa acuminata AAA Group TaxID=214697 RepID=UPI0031D8ECF5